MRKAIGWMLMLMLMCLGALPGVSQSGPVYQAATIRAVQRHQANGSDATPPSYDVSLSIGNMVYVVLYTPPFGLSTVQYAVGRELPVLVGKNTIRFNDLLGTSFEVPILSRTVETKNSPSGDSPRPHASINSTELLGLAGVQDNTGGTLAINGGRLHFVHSQGTSDIAAAVIEDLVTSDDSQPNGSGRVLSLAGPGIDSLTIQYRDADGGLHGVVFSVPAGTAESLKQELIAAGAHARNPAPADSGADSAQWANLEQKP